ncbi:hypothetical protein Tco_0471951 [Tanacetum coccineum]
MLVIEENISDVKVDQHGAAHVVVDGATAQARPPPTTTEVEEEVCVDVHVDHVQSAQKTLVIDYVKGLGLGFGSWFGKQGITLVVWDIREVRLASRRACWTIVLSVEDKLDYLDQPIPPALVPAQAGQQVALKALAAHAAWELKTLFAQQAEQELLQTVRDLHSCKQEEGQYEFDSFMQNYYMHSIGKTVNELHAMLKLHEQTLTNKDPALHVIQAGNV